MSSHEPAPPPRGVARHDGGEHLEPETLVGYRAGHLSASEESAARDHLLVCAECRELLLELAALEDGPEAAGEVSEVALARAWHEQRHRLFGSRSARLARSGWLAAAVLLAVVGLLGARLHSVGRALAGFSESDLPRAIAQERSRRSSVAGEVPVLEVDRRGPAVVLLLLRQDLPYSEYRAVFRTPDEEEILIRDGLSSHENLLLVAVRGEVLPDGEIQVVVSGRGEDERYVFVEDYSLVVRHR